MPDSVLDTLKLVLLVLLYIFFARVLWAVWSEVRQPSAHAVERGDAGADPTAPLVPADRTTTDQTRAEQKGKHARRRDVKPAKGRGTLPARVAVIDPPERRGTTYAITRTVSIGRDDGNVIQITGDTYVSGHHAQISQTGEAIVLDDLGSRNGTLLNGEKITQRRNVRVGDRIQIGFTVLEAQ